MATFFYGKCRIRAEKSVSTSTQLSHVKNTLASLEEGGCPYSLQRHELQAVWKLHGCRGKVQLLGQSPLLFTTFSRSSSEGQGLGQPGHHLQGEVISQVTPAMSLVSLVW